MNDLDMEARRRESAFLRIMIMYFTAAGSFVSMDAVMFIISFCVQMSLMRFAA